MSTRWSEGNGILKVYAIVMVMESCETIRMKTKAAGIVAVYCFREDYLRVGQVNGTGAWRTPSGSKHLSAVE